MGWLPEKVSQYFESTSCGVSLLLPVNRQANQPFLREVYELLQKEDKLTAFDIEHLKTLMMLADRLPLPSWTDSKSLIEAEAFLTQQILDINPYAIRYSLEYLYYLRQRHGRVEWEGKVSIWLYNWRLIQRFQAREQALVNDYVNWMLKNGFSAVSIRDRLLELLSFKDWMEAQGISDIDEITEAQALQYLHERGRAYQTNTCQKIAIHLQIFFDYYRERVNGLFPGSRFVAFAPRPAMA